ncbi:Disease resistance-like protein DSC1 [Vitis vinifera]|uniref:Disease resistance-like protein DSC1 n=1 Tax=Vitis vinifera TaxID=29760 RepID=A0A438ECD9_VITVI|nr:Disease resistance-like protein DSC1 [Vitis vinifera]
MASSLHLVHINGRVNTVIDDQLGRGQEISPALELIKIIDCTKVMGRAALPVFYNLDPSHVRKQTGCFAEAFAKHEEVYKEQMEKVIKWREALTEAAKISGWDSRDDARDLTYARKSLHGCDQNYEDGITWIQSTNTLNFSRPSLNCDFNSLDHNINDPFPPFCRRCLKLHIGLVGMDSHTKAMDSLLCMGLDNVQSVGILGMGGIGCTSLSKVHPSIGALNKVVFLKLAGCKNLKSFLRSICMESLEILTLSRCSKLKKFPEVQGCMKHLSELSLEGTGIKGLPLSIEYLTRLVLLNLRNCQNLESLSSCIYKLRSLEILILRLLKTQRASRDNLPEGLGSLQGLEKLKAAETAIKELPPSISLLENLEVLSFKGCKGLEFKPRNSLLFFQLLPAEIPHSGGLQLPSFSGLRSLRKLNLSDCNISERAIPMTLALCAHWNIRSERKQFCYSTCKPHQLSQLKGLRLGYCKRLQSLPELPSSIEEIDAHDCTVLENILCPSSVYTDPRNVGASDSHFLIASDCLRMKAATLWQLH